MIKFGTDGWRAVIGEEFTFQNLRIVSQAIADYLKKNNLANRVVVGYDRRFLSEEFAKDVSCVFAGNDVKVVLSDIPIPTPIVSFHSLYKGYGLGIMITASHNPAKFNGLKIKTNDGGAADKKITDSVERLLYRRKPKWMDFNTAIKKRIIKISSLTKDYEEFLKRFVDINRIKKLPLKILVDNMYGVGDKFIERVISSKRTKIDYIHNEFNPSFGGIPPEPIRDNLLLLLEKVKREGYDFGVALDGDADRLALINRKGDFIDAQVLLPLLAIHMIKNRGSSLGIGKTVVGSNLIDEVALSFGVPCYETPVRFKYISNLFKETLITIGGEEAGGIGFKDYIPERDGTASLIMLLEFMAYEGKDLEGLLNMMWRKYGRWFYKRVALHTANLKNYTHFSLTKELLGKKIERVDRKDGIKFITKDSWLMLRKSGTEPIVRIYAESRSLKETWELIELGKKLLKKS
ncbi:MAG: phosphoglucomutase/phosphomannomutase family protein [Candidatus Omnitrophica bacterium]|nr:phosphoglucomutase/phosphomannomutase family protein [Candidatus Omnitrophota bacterium]